MKNIPKTAFFYWGAPVVPYLRYMCYKSFLQYNPDWKVVLYVPVKMTTHQTWGTGENTQKYDTPDYGDKLEALGVKVCPFDMEYLGFSNDLPEVIKSDIIRLYLLSTVGGLWSDSDILFFRSLTHSISQTDHTTYFCYRRGGPTQDDIPKNGPKYHSIGFMAACPGNSYFKTLFAGCKGVIKPELYQSVGSPYYKTVVADEQIEADPLIHNFDINIVYPTRAAHNIFTDPAGRFMAEVVKNPITIALHWYAGAPNSGKYQNLMTHETYHNYDNIVSWLLERVERKGQI